MSSKIFFTYYGFYVILDTCYHKWYLRRFIVWCGVKLRKTSFHADSVRLLLQIQLHFWVWVYMRSRDMKLWWLCSLSCGCLFHLLRYFTWVARHNKNSHPPPYLSPFAINWLKNACVWNCMHGKAISFWAWHIRMYYLLLDCL